MCKMITVMILWTLPLPAISQSVSSRYRPGTIMDIRAHLAGPGKNALPRTHDISLKVDGTLYVVLYTQRPGTISPGYRTGLDLLVLVGRYTITFNHKLGPSRELPILSCTTISDATRQYHLHRKQGRLQTHV